MLAVVAAAFAILSTGFHLLSCAAVAWRCRPARSPVPVPVHAPRIALVRPVCGLDHRVRATLGSTFGLDYPDYEIIFCAAHERDPVVPVVRQLIAGNPGRNARLLFGEDRLNGNPKLNNMAKAWAATQSERVVFTDSNVLLPPDYLQRLLAAEDDDTGMVSAPPVGVEVEGMAGELECAFLNTWQARVQYTVAMLGHGFAQGKTLMFRRDVLDREGGMAALAREPAEDAAATKATRRQGLLVALANGPFAQPIGSRRWRDVWVRQLRWARLRRATFPLLYLPEALAGAIPPALAAGWAGAAGGLDPAALVLASLGLWYAAEAGLARAAGWHLTWASPLALLLRDLLLLPLWLGGWGTGAFEWRGNAVPVTLEASSPAGGGS